MKKVEVQKRSKYRKGRTDAYPLYILYYRCDDRTVEHLKWINFPPIISKMNVKSNILSHYMAGRYEQEEKKMDQEALIQTYKGKDLFLLTDLLRFYLDLGYEIRNIQTATQYLGENCMAPFINKVVDMRIKATDEGDETKANTAKILGNASYGKLLQNPEKYKRCVLVDDDNIFRYMRKPNLHSHTTLETESGIYIFTFYHILIQ